MPTQKSASQNERLPSHHEGYLLNSIFKNSIEGIVISDDKNTILAVNKAFTEIMGYQAEEVVGKNGTIFRASHHNKEFYKTVWNKVEKEGQWEGEMWVRRKNGETLPEWLIFTKIKDEAGNILFYLSIFSDITERKTTTERIQFLTRFDPLTRLPSRISFLEHLSDEIKRLNSVGILILKINRFHAINNALGPDMGDAVLEAIAERLQKIAPQALMISRFSGSEFGLLFSGKDLPLLLANHASSIIHSLTHSFKVQEKELSLTINIGISISPEDETNPKLLIKNAEIAMQQSRNQLNTYLFYKSEMNVSVSERIKLENQLKNAIENEELILYYQPLVNLKTRKIIGSEALLRWNLNNELISAARFISIAEQSGFIHTLTDWVLREACKQLQKWISEGFGPFIMAVNISSTQFKQPGFQDNVLTVIEQMQIDPHFLKLEITEDLLLHDFEQVISIMNSLKQRGIKFAIDDFGTGYSSLSYLLKLPVAQLKIDQSFTKGITTTPENKEIIRAIVSVAKSLHLSVIAEGIEEQDQLDFLSSLGCNEGQGYLWGKPMPPQEFEQLIQAQKR